MATTLVVLFGMMALALDVGHLYTAKAELQAAADAIALAAASGLPLGQQAVWSRASEYAAKNTANGQPVVIQPSDLELGSWNPVARTFSPATPKPDACRVTARLDATRGNAVALSFAHVFALHEADVSASAIAVFRSRDIMLVLDLSASMTYDSMLWHIDSIGQQAVEANLFQIWTELGSPTYGNMQWDPIYIESVDVETVKRTLGLTGVPYPYPKGSWNEFVWYVTTWGGDPQGNYRKKYGYLTLVNYWLSWRPMASETPGLWRTSQQPLTAVKDAIEQFLPYIQQFNTNDRVGLAVYTSSNGTAKLESGLTHNFQLIDSLTKQRQAGHYHYSTNIQAGIKVARLELQNNGRLGAYKMMVLLTDGVPNMPSNARQAALNEAQLVAVDGIPIFTISLGALADVALMQTIADITKGSHFNIPGGQTVAKYSDDLAEFFRRLADHRPLRLVD